LRRLEDCLGIELLLVKCGEDSVWAWLGGRGRIEAAAVERIAAGAGLEEVSLAVGEPQHGLEGWRLSHREAAGAALVARFRPGPVTRYADVAPEVTALQNPALADSLVERYLQPLDGLQIGGDDARRALRALFDSKHNVSSAAHRLGVHRSTVHRWRNCIEERLGPLQEHQADIEIALRVEQLRANL
jgi:DNA-binding PucR family transcriptional regulator